ncbi:MAG: hypothetical protein IJD16_03825 [Desulfovibrio sp.]|nr:hypothetical protein [Desulfovibrio sp.]
MQKETYLKTEAKARFTFYAVNGRQRMVIRGTSRAAVMARLRELWPSGSFRDLWQQLEQPIQGSVEVAA